MLLLESSDAAIQPVTLLIAPHLNLCDVLFPIMSTPATKIYHLFIKKIKKSTKKPCMSRAVDTEREGFEPSVTSLPRSISSRVP